VFGIAKSIAKWTHLKFCEEMFIDYVKKTHTSEIQSARGRKSSGGGRPSLGAPWLAMGISRSTFFRRKSKSSK